MTKLVLSISFTVLMAFLAPHHSEARSIHPDLAEMQLTHQINLLERKIAEMTNRLESLRAQLCALQESCGDPEPEGAVLIAEVLFDPGPTDIQGTDLENEWIEIYNGTNEEVDLNGWSIGDGTGTDSLSSEEFILGSGKHLIVTRSASTDTFWTYGAGTVVIHLENPLGSGGLRNDGETVFLYDADETLVDAVSWGDDLSTLNPPVDIASMEEGQSIVRLNKTVDTDLATDWVIADTPTPGS